MEKWKKRSVNLLFSMIFGGDGDCSVVPYYPQKNMIGSSDERIFPRGNPESHGISSKRLYNMLSALEEERRANIHSLMVIAEGEVICECSTEGYDASGWQVSHSMAKTVVGIIIGGLIDEGVLSLDTKLVDIFSDLPYRDKRFALITVEHLLSMTAGVDFGEAGAVTESLWTLAFFNSSVRFIPGKRFLYNSMNSYILARVAERVSGKKFGELAREAFFEPMHINNYLWEQSPEGCEKAGWGLYMSLESWAKVGYMILSKGVYGGKRIVSEKWIELSTVAKAIAPNHSGGFDYGYHIWVSRDGNEILLSGMLGQNVWINPQNNIIVVMTGGNNEIFQASPALEIIRSYLCGRIEDRLNKKDISLLRSRENTFFKSRRWLPVKEKSRGVVSLFGKILSGSYENSFRDISGKYLFAKNSLSLEPMILGTMQNNFKRGIESIEFYMAGDSLQIFADEGGELHRIEAGIYEYKSNLLSIRGEMYRVQAIAGYQSNKFGEREYRIELIFSETACVRRIKAIKRTNDQLLIRLSETPNNRLIENLLDEYSSQSTTISFAKGLIERKFGENVIREKAHKTFTPQIVGVREGAKGYKRILYNSRPAEESGSIKIIRAFLERFFNDDERGKKSKDLSATDESNKEKNKQKM